MSVGRGEFEFGSRLWKVRPARNYGRDILSTYFARKKWELTRKYDPLHVRKVGWRWESSPYIFHKYLRTLFCMDDHGSTDGDMVGYKGRYCEPRRLNDTMVLGREKMLDQVFLSHPEIIPWKDNYVHTAICSHKGKGIHLIFFVKLKLEQLG